MCDEDDRARAPLLADKLLHEVVGFCINAEETYDVSECFRTLQTFRVRGNIE